MQLELSRDQVEQIGALYREVVNTNLSMELSDDLLVEGFIVQVSNLQAVSLGHITPEGGTIETENALLAFYWTMLMTRYGDEGRVRQALYDALPNSADVDEMIINGRSALTKATFFED